MNGLSSPQAMYVRALYDYHAEDRTSLSFKEGELLQVLNRLESGWMDSLNEQGVRGWAPSNYCTAVEPEDESGEEYGDHDLGPPSFGHGSNSNSRLHLDESNEEEAAFWIPQATPDGRLFYFNTLTGVSTMELPLESPAHGNETGPRDRTNVDFPHQTRPPPELLAAGYERGEDMNGEHTNDSDANFMTLAGSVRSLSRNRASYTPDGVSPAVSMESLKSPNMRSRSTTVDSTAQSFSVATHANPPNGTTATSFANTSLAPSASSLVSRQLFDDAQPVVLSWNTLVEDMRRSVQRFREAINNSDRADFVRRAEDISDHLRLLLAAGSGTTDNHSGNPSIISTNKPLYPHFREMMSSFSKLVLSSHFAAADFTTSESYSKCLQEAEGLLHGVYGYVEVARQQRGEEIPRLAPGFLSGSKLGGSWQGNALDGHDLTAALPSMMRDDGERLVEPTEVLDAQLLEKMQELQKLIVTGIKQLDEHLVLHDNLITPRKHRSIGDAICKESGRIIRACQPYISSIETINLAPLGSGLHTTQLDDFNTQKQKFYDATVDLVVACQGITSPLADEWSELRGNSLEERLQNVKSSASELDSAVNSLHNSVQLLSELVPLDNSRSYIDHRNTIGTPTYGDSLRTMTQKPKMLGDVGVSKSFSEGLVEQPTAIQRNGETSKVQRFFGEVPAPLIQPPQGGEDVPEYLRLDHETEIAYDSNTPPQLRGGTLIGLVEQLTRHDRLDSPFNNTFLLTYRSFTTAPELFEMLVKRWTIQPPQGLSAADLQTWVDKKQKPIRFRVVNILKSWFDNYWMEGTDDASQQLMQRVYIFAKETVASTSTPGAGPLMTAIEQRMRGQDASSKRLVLTINAGSTPPPIVPKNLRRLKFLDIDALEFARQLTIIECRLYCKIKPTECLNKTWQKKLSEGEADPAANVKALILHSNQLTNWCAQMILTQADVKRRQVVIKQFVAIADKCRQLNNFSTLTSIISALGTAPIHRLGRTWTQVNQKTMTILEALRKLMGSTRNFFHYREALHQSNPPCIPFFGVYLTDLTFIEDGIPSIIKKTNLINFAKRAKTADVIRDVQQYQNVPYALQAVPELQDYILKNMQTAGDVHEMYDRSLAVEPREREDEKIARLLSESGFL